MEYGQHLRNGMLTPNEPSSTSCRGGWEEIQIKDIKRAESQQRHSMPLAALTPFTFLLSWTPQEQPRTPTAAAHLWCTESELLSPGLDSGIGGGKNLREGCGGLQRNEELSTERQLNVRNIHKCTHLHLCIHTPITVSKTSSQFYEDR